jgi:hypothetical protein
VVAKNSLLLHSALCGLMAVGAAVPAHAQKARAKNQDSAQIQSLQNEIEVLKAQVNALIANQQQVQRTAEQAQAQVAVQEQKVAAQAAAVPEQVKTALAAQPKPKPQWFDDTKISGRMYWNFSNVNQKTNDVKTASSGTGFAIKRFYVGVDHKFDDMFAVNLTTDIDNVVGPNNNNLVGKGLYVKKAYVEAKLDPALVIRLGAADTPWIPFAEGVYGYRHYENTLSDRTRFGTSADWGVHALGSVADKIVSYQVSVVNGRGYRDATVTNSVDIEGRISAQYKGFTAGIGGYTGKLGNDRQGAVTYHTANRLNALVAYKAEMFSAGFEYFYAENWNTVASVNKDEADGYSLFASVSPIDKISVFGRYDWVKPRKKTVSGLKDDYFNVGVQYSPAKIVDFALLYKRDKVQNGSFSTSNGTIVGIPGGRDGTYDEFGLFGQVRF